MTDLRDFEADIDRILTRLERAASFADIVAQRVSGQGIRLDRRSTSPSMHARLHGAALRAWEGSHWIEAASSDLSLAGLEVAADGIERALEAAPVRSDPPGPSSVTDAEASTNPPHPVSELGVEGMIALGKDVLGWATQVPTVRDAIVRIGWSDEERLYLNTAGARTYQRVTRVEGTVVPLAFEDGRVEFDFLGEGGVGGRECLEFLNETRVKEAAESSRSLLSAKAPPTGAMTVILDPGVAGTFAHESFGHGTEADQFVRDRSYLKPILGQVVGPETLTLVDNGAYPGGWGTIYFDDEGNPGQRTVLVQKGRFIGALHDRETAQVLHARPTGNTRRADFLSRPFVRMTNTYIEPGTWTLDELVKEAKNGVLLERATSGIEDPLGGQMQLKVKRGRKIENGVLTDVVTSMALSGKVLDFLKGIRGVSKANDFRIEPGYCGKGHSDIVPAGTGGTYLLSDAIVGPA
ncbi:MAG TPA: TldD/PmbA family protein [Thermoplasmata archaeon]|nr:TldD/PmbA family protein [Thermoplasmata archaeon]